MLIQVIGTFYVVYERTNNTEGFKSDINGWKPKDATPLSLGPNCLHFIFWKYLIGEIYYCKYAKLPNIVFNACKNITENKLLEICGSQMRLFYLRFDPLRRNK